MKRGNNLVHILTTSVLASTVSTAFAFFISTRAPFSGWFTTAFATASLRTITFIFYIQTTIGRDVSGVVYGIFVLTLDKRMALCRAVEAISATGAKVVMTASDAFAN